MTTSTNYASATRQGVRRLSRSLGLAGFYGRAVEFRQVYMLYRRAAHSPAYCARIAWWIAFLGRPF